MGIADSNILASKVKSADDAVCLIANAATIGIAGAGGGLMEPDAILAGIERRFLKDGLPEHLTVVHAQGLGDRKNRGLNRLAYEGLVKRVIGSHWGWSPRMQELAKAEKIEAYAFPGGAIQHLVRESGARRPGLITPIGLGTMVDPRLNGGRMNLSASDSLNELINIDGQDYIRYRPIALDVAIIRGSFADAKGNVSFEEEGAELDALVLAHAAHNAGGIVLVQVRQLVTEGSLPARKVRLPGALVDVIVIADDQPQSYADRFDDSVTGSNVRPVGARLPLPHDAAPIERQIIAERASQELRGGEIASFGLGIPDEVSRIAACRGIDCHQTVDHGHYGGRSLSGALFGFVSDGEALIDSPSQFDFYSGGGIDIAFLGFGEFDQEGNVNVSLLGGKLNGPGGFIDISQGAQKIVFCGTFETSGLCVEKVADTLHIRQPGASRKLVDRVAQVTFSGKRACELGQEVLLVTERAVFQLAPSGVIITEIAPGIDLFEDVIDRMGFQPEIPKGGPRLMTI